ncbi:MAG TPA: hypothetical protein VF719_12910 [Abditibacteriaceae bacterium]|jgi:hypothetical protein
MKLNIHVQNIKETVEVKDADEALHRAKQEAAKRAPFLMRAVVNAMPDLTFAAEVVKRHNSEAGGNDPAPASAQEFLDWAIKRGYVSHAAG